MKKYIVFLLCMAIGFAVQTIGQKAYKFGDKTQSALTSALTISITPASSLTLYTLTADTNVTFNAVTTYAVPADLLIFRIKGNTRQRVLTWGTALDGLNDTIATNKTWTYSFIWDGTAYKKLCKSITD